MADASAFKKLSQREHVLARPGMYIGSVEAETCSAWVIADETASTEPEGKKEEEEEEEEDTQEGGGEGDNEGGKKMKKRKAAAAAAAVHPPHMTMRNDLRYVPGLFKIYDEIIVNAIDHATRLKRQRQTDDTVVPVKRIAVGIDRVTGVIEVTNDGDGIPVQLHPEHGCYVPELIFGHLLTSANYDDEAEAASAEGGRTIGGQNGIGAKACNIFCRWFEVETVDRVRKKIYTQRFEENMARTLAPAVKACPKKPYVKIRFLPDYTRFGMPDGLSADMYALMARRVYDATAVTDPDVAVFFDGKRIEAKSFER